MSIYKSAIEKPVTTALIFVAVIVIGIYSFLKLPIDQFPEMDPPYITVMTTYPGASASEMETNVTKIMENALTSVDHLKHITSQSKDNISVATLELEWGANMDEAVNGTILTVSVISPFRVRRTAMSMSISTSRNWTLMVSRWSRWDKSLRRTTSTSLRVRLRCRRSSTRCRFVRSTSSPRR